MRACGQTSAKPVMHFYAGKRCKFTPALTLTLLPFIDLAWRIEKNTFCTWFTHSRKTIQQIIHHLFMLFCGFNWLDIRFAVATRWLPVPEITISLKGKYINYLFISDGYLVAGVGFEPTTFRLWAWRATGLLHPAPNENSSARIVGIKEIQNCRIDLLIWNLKR